MLHPIDVYVLPSDVTRETANNLAIGDMVKLRSGGYPINVTAVLPGGENYLGVCAHGGVNNVQFNWRCVVKLTRQDYVQIFTNDKRLAYIYADAYALDIIEGAVDG